MSGRHETVRNFLASHGWGGAEREKLPGDASFRRYERLRLGGASAMLMDAPPPMEDVRPFVKVARLLLALGLSAPRILAADEAAGLLVLEDLGDRTYTRLLEAGGDEAQLYGLAVDTLVALQRRFDPALADLPPYDEQRLLAEAALLPDWFMPAVGIEVAPALREEYLALWRAVLPVARGAPPTLVLRDYHVDNLMLLEGRAGIASCGLLDFQDAVIGPASYDLVSLLEDARRDVSPAIAVTMLQRYLDAFPRQDRAAFAASFAVLGAQRNAKIVGIFTRLWKRDGKDRYLAHIPRVWRLLEGDLRHPALASVRAFLDRHVPAQLRQRPPGKDAA